MDEDFLTGRMDIIIGSLSAPLSQCPRYRAWVNALTQLGLDHGLAIATSGPPDHTISSVNVIRTLLRAGVPAEQINALMTLLFD